MEQSTDLLPSQWYDDKDFLRKVSLSVNNILRGKTNNTGSVTLTESSATTTFTDIRIGINSVIVLQPTTANASAEIGAGTIYFDDPGKGTIVINHANNAQTDRIFRFAILG